MLQLTAFLHGLALWAALPSTQLPLTLVGVVVGAAPAPSVSMIRCDGRAADSAVAMYRVGERACDVAEIRDIRADAVIIRNLVSNRLERLSLHNSGTAPIAAAAIAAPPTAPMVVRPSPTGATVDVPKATVDHYLLNLTELLTAALATPHFQDAGNGQRVMDGFQLGEIRPGSVIEQLGLKNGDVITEVNGDKLDSMAAVIRLAGQAQNMGQAKMLVLRAGKPMTFVFNTK